MHFQIDRSNAQPMYQQLVSDIQQRIRSGALPPGARLPTVRELAQQLGVTRLTIHSAYSELQAGGWVEATVGRGTFVSARLKAHGEATELGREFTPHGMIRDMIRMAQLPGMRSLAMADADPHLFPKREFGRAMEETLAHDSTALSYTSAQGDPLLRTVLAEYLRERAIHASPDEMLITNGVTQSMALAARTFAAPGDAVLVEKPTYVGAINVFASHGLRVIGVPIDQDGIVVDALERLVAVHKPRFLYTIPAFQNPSGVCLAPQRAAALLELARRLQLPIIEDAIYAQLAFDRPAPPSLKSQDRHGVVIHVNSFSKDTLPGIRIGYTIAAPQVIKRLTSAKLADDLCSSPLLQRALAVFIERGQYANHLRRVVPHYRERRDAIIEAMALYFPATAQWTVPQGGFSVWVALPHGVSPTDLYLAAIERGVAFAPGDFFFAEPSPQPFMRLSFSLHSPDVLRDVTRTIGELLGSQLHRRSYHRTLADAYIPLV